MSKIGKFNGENKSSQQEIIIKSFWSLKKRKHQQTYQVASGSAPATSKEEKVALTK